MLLGEETVISSSLFFQPFSKTKWRMLHFRDLVQVAVLQFLAKCHLIGTRQRSEKSKKDANGGEQPKNGEEQEHHTRYADRPRRVRLHEPECANVVTQRTQQMTLRRVSS